VRGRAPDQLVWDVNAAQVMAGAERDQVLRRIGAAVRAQLHVMGVHRPPAASRRLASTEVALADLLRERPRLLHAWFPRLDEVPGHQDEAPPVVKEPLFGRPHRPEGGLERQRNPDG